MITKKYNLQVFFLLITMQPFFSYLKRLFYVVKILIFKKKKKNLQNSKFE